MDVHVPMAITTELRLRGVEVLTAQEDEAGEFKDPKLLDRASALERVLVTQDVDFLREAARRRDQSVPFLGIIYIPQLDITIGRAVTDLELCAKACTPEEWINQVEFLPL
jgi:predicted nuclease of predicted toxin-antitoxin system